MAAAITDKLTDTRNAARPNSARVSSGRSGGGTTLACDNLAGWPTASKVHFVTYRIDSNSNPVSGTQLDCSGIVSGNNIGSLTVIDGTDTGNSINDVVEMLPTAAWGQDLADALTAAHDRVGVHKSGAAYASPAFSGTATGTYTLAGTPTITSPTISSPTISGTVSGQVIGGTNLTTSAITLGYAEITTGYSATPGAGVYTDVTGLSVTVTVPAGGRRIKITAWGSALTDNAAGSATEVRFAIRESSTTLTETQFQHTIAGQEFFHFPIYSTVATAGSHTYKVSLKENQGGNVALNAASTSPAFILVEAI